MANSGIDLRGCGEVESPHRQYGYTRLSNDEDFRLLRISLKEATMNASDGIADWNIEIVHMSWATAPMYETVSYTWGPPHKTHYMTLMGDFQLPITASIRSALPHLLMTSRTGLLWIDQLCIDQDNVGERNHQVQMMGKIYSSASRVIVWLGEPDSTTDDFIKLYQVPNQAPKVTPELPITAIQKTLVDMLCDPANEDRYLISLCKLVERPWFVRGWVLQEVVLSREVNFLLGAFSLDFDHLIAVTLSPYHDVRHSDALISRFTFDQFRGHGCLFSMYATKRKYFHDSLDFPTFIINTSLDVSDPRDHIYAFLGLLNDDRINIVSDYELNVKEVFTKATKAIMQGTRSLDILAGLGPDNLLSRLEIAGVEISFPSWVPDYSQLTTVMPLDKMHLFHASQKRPYLIHEAKAGSDRCIVTGRVIGRVSAMVSIDEYHDQDPIAQQVKATLSLNRYIEQLLGKWPIFTNSVSRARLLRVLLGGTVEKSGEVIILDDAELESIYKIWREVVELDYESKVEGDDDFHTRLRYLYFESRVAARRVIICSSNGKLGLAPKKTEENDEISIIHGSDTPLIIRPTATGEYQLVGQCYLEDAMLGEACTWAEDEAQEFTLV